MRPRLPLYAKILLWFFLNVALLAAVFLLLFNAQFQMQLDWVFATGARERVEAVRDLVIGELNVTSPYEWGRVLDRFSAAHGVRMGLFDEDGDWLLGNLNAVPPEVRARMRPPVPPPGPGSVRPPGGMDDTRGPPIRAFVRTTRPIRYWLVLSGRIDNQLYGNPARVILVTESNALSSGGLIFDPKPWIALGVGALAFSVLFWLPLVRGITRSIAQMMVATQHIAEGRFESRVNTRRRDELGLLGQAINRMAEQLDGMVKGQKRFLGDIAHELCSPLAKLQMTLGILDERASGAPRKYVVAANEKAHEIARLVEELLSFSKASFGPSVVRLGPVQVREVVEEAIRRELPDGAGIQNKVALAISVNADRELLLRALANLLRNAIRHAGNSGPIEISAHAERDEVVIRLTDSGPGVPEKELAQIFDAFYRLDTARTRETGGTGLGLAIVKTCIESCGGSVQARNRPPRGLEVSIRLQARAASAEASFPSKPEELRN